MKKVLMILTSHRLDCLSLCMDLLIRNGSIKRFDVVALLCNGVTEKHKAWIDRLIASQPNVQWDVISGPRGRGKFISSLQNRCVERHPESLYFKLDEDTFVSRDWDLKLIEAYERFKGDPALSLITPVVTNNQRGAYHLLTTFPEVGAAYTRQFNKPIVTDRMGPVWMFPQQAEFMMRSFINLDDANAKLRAVPGEDFLTFSYPFSINCLCYDFRHWQEIGGVPEEDENGWGKWIPENKKFIVLATRAVVHHYSFFVQQNWLDRTSLLEDLREANLGDRTGPIARFTARMGRTIPQIPDALKRRFAKK